MPSRDTSLKRSAQNEIGPSAAISSNATNTNILFRTGGAYIPPAKLRMLQEQIKDKKSEDYQRMSWEALKKSINGLINKINTANIKEIIPELFQENLIRGQGLFCRSLMKAQFNSIPFTPVYASLVGVINSKLPDIGRLLLFRLIHQFRRAYRRNDKAICLANLTFLAHLINHQLVHEILALQILALLLQKPTDDSVEIAVGFMKECGHHLSEVSPKGTNAVFERFRTILHEGDVDKRIQYMIEVLFQVRRDKFKDHPSVVAELDLVDEDDQITHNIELDDDEVEPHEELSAFKYDPDYEENEENYAEIKKEILGDDESDEDGEDESGSEEGDSDEEPSNANNTVVIQDKTGTNLVNLRRSIYLTIKSSADFEECAHKLLRIQLQPEDETEFCNMIVECASQERIYNKFYGLLGERFCRLQHKWSERFEAVFVQTYENIHQYETNRIRIIAKFFGHLLATDAIPWPVFSVIQLTEDTTTSASRIFLKVLLNEIVEAMGVNQLNQRFKNPEFEEAFRGLFPTDTPKNTRFAINYFTSIGLGALTEELRVQLQKVIEEAQRRREEESGSDSSATDSDSSSSETESESETDSRSRSRSSSRDYRNRSRYRSRSPSHSRSPAYRSESRYRSRR